MSQSSNIRPAPQDEELVKAKAIDVPGIEASAPSFLESTLKPCSVQNSQLVRTVGKAGLCGFVFAGLQSEVE